MLPVINKDEVKRYAGLRHAEDFPEKFVDEACKEIQLLATPKGVYQEYDYDAENKVILSNPPLKNLKDPSLKNHLEKFYKGVCTRCYGSAKTLKDVANSYSNKALHRRSITRCGCNNCS